MDCLLTYFSDFTETQLRQFQALDALYREWNQRINVISRKDIDQLYERHILHSLSIAASFELPSGATVIDIGTGGGFPGIPLAIFFPEVRFHLVDSIAKKLKVVSAVVEAIGLTNVTVQQGRAQEIRGRKFDYAVSRAVAPLKELWQWSRPLLRPGTGGLICLKGGDLTEEIRESGTRPRMLEIVEIFKEDFFREKFVLFIPR